MLLADKFWTLLILLCTILIFSPTLSGRRYLSTHFHLHELRRPLHVRTQTAELLEKNMSRIFLPGIPENFFTVHPPFSKLSDCHIGLALIYFNTLELHDHDEFCRAYGAVLPDSRTVRSLPYTSFFQAVYEKMEPARLFPTEVSTFPPLL